MSATLTTSKDKFYRGDKVSLKDRNDKLIKGVVKRHSDSGVVINGDDGKRYLRDIQELIFLGGSDVDIDSVEAVAPADGRKPKLPPPSDKLKDFDINQRFTFLGQLVRNVLSRNMVSCIITGEGGLGKTWTVNRELNRKGYTKNNEYIVIKGFTTPRGLYRTLYENNGKVIIFDDCDEALEDKIAKNLLKAALDSYDEREISWITKSTDESLPDSFIFDGVCIFISNLSQERIDGAILSRSTSIDVSMNRMEKVERMRHIAKAKEYMPLYSAQVKSEALDIIEENIEDVRELSLRSLGKVIKILSGEKDMLDTTDPDFDNIDLKELARFMLLS